MTTQKQIEANRRNALKSFGPKTSQGKKKSSRNALKHGLSSSSKFDADADQKIARLARALSNEIISASPSSIQSAAAAEIEVQQVRMRKAELWEKARRLDGTSVKNIITAANRIDRYERRAKYHRKQAIRQLLAEAVDI